MKHGSFEILGFTKNMQSSPNVGSHSNATQKHSTRAQKMECYGSNPFVLKMDWSWATTFQLYIALYTAHELAFRKWEAEKREQSNPHSRMCICFDWTWIGEWRFHSECDPTLIIWTVRVWPKILNYGGFTIYYAKWVNNWCTLASIWHFKGLKYMKLWW